MPPNNDIAEIKATVQKMIQLMTGNDLDPNDTGFIGDLHDTRERVLKIEEKFKKAMWVIIGMAVPGGFGFAKILLSFASLIDSIHK